MPARPQAIDSDAAAFAEITRKIRDIEDAMRSRLLPPGYTFNIVDGYLVIERSDGATSTLVFT